MKKETIWKMARGGFAVLMLSTLALGAACSGGGQEMSEGSGKKPPIIVLGKSARLVDVDLSEIEMDVRNEVTRRMSDTVRYTYSCEFDYNRLPYSYEMDDMVVTDAAPDADMSPVPSVSADFNESVGADYTDTNIQEEGVDEADLFKTDGEYAYVLRKSKLRIMQIWPFDEFKSVSELEIEGFVNELYLTENKIVTFSNVSGGDENETLFNGVKITIIDITDRYNPEVLRESYYEGFLVSSRRIDDKVHIVLNSNFVVPAEVKRRLDESIVSCTNGFIDNYQQAIAAKDQLIEENSEIIKSVSASRFLPRIIHKDNPVNYEMRLTMKRSELNKGTSLISLVTVDLDDITGNDSITSVVGHGGIVYASEDSIFVTQRVNSWETTDADPTTNEATLIHRFDISSNKFAPNYYGTGAVAGHLLSEYQRNAQFSLSEYNRTLRVATTIGWGESNNVYILNLADPSMPVLGAIGGIGKGERIYAVRFMGPKGYVVTFRQIDPLFTMDLSNSVNPKLLGELKIPGFSTYLHPFGDDHLIGIGRSGNNRLKLSLFDVSDMTNPKETHVYEFNAWDSDAQYDHHAFTFDKEHGLLAIPVNYSMVELLSVSPADGFQSVGSVSGNHAMRSTIIGDESELGLVVTSEDSLSLSIIDDGLDLLDTISW